MKMISVFLTFIVQKISHSIPRLIKSSMLIQKRNRKSLLNVDLEVKMDLCRMCVHGYIVILEHREKIGL